MTTIRFKTSEQKARAIAWLSARRLRFKSMGPALLAMDEANLALLKEQRLAFLVPAADPAAERSDGSEMVCSAGMVVS